MVLRGTSTPRQAAVQRFRLSLTSEVAGACYFPRDVSNYIQTVVQMYSHGILVVFVYSHGILVVFSLSSSQNASNGSPTHARTPYALVHMMAAHTAFDYELVTRGSGCTWSLCHVPFSFFGKRNGLPPPPAPLSPSSAVPILEPPTCLYCTDIRTRATLFVNPRSA